MLTKITDGIWVAHQPLKVVGVELGARMTVISLSGDEGLFVHSPISPTDELVAELKRIGPVKHVIAPNLFHHLFIGDFKKHFPEAKLYCAPGLEKKRQDVKFDAVIDENGVYPWSKDFKHHIVGGFPLGNEVVFFHERLRTLVVTDLGLYICDEHPLLTRLLFKCMGMFKKFGWSRSERWLFVRNNELFNSSLAKIRRWNFDRIILSHGRIVETGGHHAFEHGYG